MLKTRAIERKQCKYESCGSRCTSSAEIGSCSYESSFYLSGNGYLRQEGTSNCALFKNYYSDNESIHTERLQTCCVYRQTSYRSLLEHTHRGVGVGVGFFSNFLFTMGPTHESNMAKFCQKILYKWFKCNVYI